jgi:ParB family transcriptional regulator, chromosome partitioning protein
MFQIQQLRDVSVDMIEPNLSQPRRRFDEGTLQELAGSIDERGVLQPVLVRPLADGSYQLVAGERRWRAAKIAGLETIPALVSAYDDAAALQIALIENMVRANLNPVEEARACATLSQEFGLTHQQIAIRVGRQTSVVSNLIRLLKLSEEILELVERGQLSSTHGHALLTAKDLEARGALARAAVQEGWPVRTLEGRVRASNVDLLESLKDRGEQARDPKQARDLEALNVARAWGDLLGAEVHVRPMWNEQMRIEVEFDFASEGLALAERLTSVVAGGSTRR